MSVRGVAFVVSGILLALLEGVLYRFWAPFSSFPIFGRPLASLLHGATPNLVLPLVLYLGIVETSMARGAFLSFGLGWVLDILGGGPAFLFRFAMVAVWGLARSLSTRVSAFSLVSRVMLAFLGSLLESSIVLMLLAIFGPDSQRPVDLGDQVIPHALSTALFSPLIFSLAHRMQLETRSSAEAGASGAGG